MKSLDVFLDLYFIVCFFKTFLMNFIDFIRRDAFLKAFNIYPSFLTIIF